MARRLTPEERFLREQEVVARRHARILKRLQKEEEQEAKRKARQQEREAKERARLTAKALRPLNKLISRATANFDHYCPDQDPFWDKNLLIRRFPDLPNPKTYISEWEREYDLEAKRIARVERSKRRVENRIWRIHKAMMSWYVDDMDSDMIMDAGRDLGQIIFEIQPFRYVGWTSFELLRQQREAKLRGETLDATEDHIYPRQLAGEVLVYHLLLTDGEMSLEQLRRYIEVFRQVARVTSTENTALVPFQKRKVFISPEHAYEQVGIEIVFTDDGAEMVRLEDVAPYYVLEEIFGERLDEMYKYSSRNVENHFPLAYSDKVG